VTRDGPSPAQKAARHLAQARQHAEEQIRLLVDEMSLMHGISSEITAGGPIYPAGVRELAGRFNEELEQKAKSIASIMQWPAEPKA
jgi:hypothetical protein